MLCAGMDLKQIDSDLVSDTSPRAAAVQLGLYRRAGPSGRARVAVELSDAVHDTTVAGIRRRHPEYSERDVALSFLRLVYGFRRSLGGEERSATVRIHFDGTTTPPST
jgi:hypothetical protein